MNSAARFAAFLGVVLSIWALQHLYVGSRLWSLPALSSPAARRSLVALMFVGFWAYFLGRLAGSRGAYSVAAVFEYGGGLWIGVVFLLMMVFLLVDLLTLGGLVLKTWVPQLRTAAALLALIASAVAWIGGVRPPRVIALELPSQAVPTAASGLRILQLSDLHLGVMAGRGRLAQVRELIAELAPDALVVTGDLVDGDVEAVRRLLPELRQVVAPLGVYVVLGNHEYYDRRGPEASRELFSEAGYVLLENTTVELVPGIFLIGVPDDGGARQTGHPRADLEAATAAVPADALSILLQHSPGDEELADSLGVDLMLNGHTHGGQIWPFNYLVALNYRPVAGQRQVGSMVQMVSRGAGLWGPPMRLFAPSDVVLITLRHADSSSNSP